MHMCLNSLADDKLTASVRCLSANGHLLEIGKYDILKGTALSMRPMHDNITFHGINLDSLFKGAQKEAVSYLCHSGITFLCCICAAHSSCQACAHTSLQLLSYVWTESLVISCTAMVWML